jgi:hypothetical protein
MNQVRCLVLYDLWLRMIFIMIKSRKKILRVIFHYIEKFMKFKFPRPLCLRTQPYSFVYMLFRVTSILWQNWKLGQRPNGLQHLEYFLSKALLKHCQPAFKKETGRGLLFLCMTSMPYSGREQIAHGTLLSDSKTSQVLSVPTCQFGNAGSTIFTFPPTFPVHDPYSLE